MTDDIQHNATGTIFPNSAEVDLYEGRFVSSGEVPNVSASRITGKFLTFMTQLLERVCIAGNGKIHTNNTDSMQLINAIQVLAKKAADNALPIGTILDFDGAVADVPQGWAICDGRKYIMGDQSEMLTPDLRNKFIMGSDEASLRTTGGANEYSLTEKQMPAHNHFARCHTNGNHYHTYTYSYGYINSVGRDGALIASESAVTSLNTQTNHTNNSGNHQHGITIEHAGISAKIDNKPAYYAVIKIRRYE